jgi:hypothetical protein
MLSGYCIVSVIKIHQPNPIDRIPFSYDCLVTRLSAFRKKSLSIFPARGLLTQSVSTLSEHSVHPVGDRHFRKSNLGSYPSNARISSRIREIKILGLQIGVARCGRIVACLDASKKREKCFPRDFPQASPQIQTP